MKILHTMIRVKNLEESIKFYEDIFEMKLLRKNDYPSGKFTLAFLGYEGNAKGEAEIELTYNYGVDNYDLGNAFGHIAIGVENAYETCEKIKAKGGKVVRDAGPMQHGTTVIAFVEDPNGYKIELIQKG